MRQFKTCHIYFETSHEKLKLDNLGGVIKSFVGQAVTSEKVVIRNASEFQSFCQENLTLKNKTELHSTKRTFHCC